MNDKTLPFLNNPKDPLLKTGPEAGRVLFEQFNRIAASGFQNKDVIDAATNILVNMIRQTYDNAPHAERAFDELYGRTKALLMNHYDPVTRKRRNIFPFTQHIHAMRIVDKDR